MEEKNIKSNYYIAVHYLNNALILCNDIVEIDNTVFDNCRFESYDEETDTYTEIFQYFITDCSEYDVEFLEKHFDLLFSYSELLGKHILCVDHYGTMWQGVSVYTDLEGAAEK